jgi:hypothetical protein
MLNNQTIVDPNTALIGMVKATKALEGFWFSGRLPARAALTVQLAGRDK